ncbi:MAG: adenylate/guanylate cyclase domain-containing protein [Bacteroidota bacterium]
MEENIAILIIDLSGYTALTETHGPLSAADLIDRYIQIAESCMVADCKIHERTGDEIMIVSTSADFLLATAIMIESYTSKEEHFLQVHGGLHIGKLLKRNNSYFGSALNFSSRIASKADAGTFWCSAEFADALTHEGSYLIRSKGMHSFKNIHGEKEVFELINKNKQRNYIDPVCRMQIIDLENAFPSSGGGPLYFCSSHCLELYKQAHAD